MTSAQRFAYKLRDKAQEQTKEAEAKAILEPDVARCLAASALALTSIATVLLEMEREVNSGRPTG